MSSHSRPFSKNMILHTTFPGDVIEVKGRRGRSKRAAYYICVSEEHRLFVRVSEDPLFKPHAILSATEYTWLERDSYVELTQLYEFSPEEIDAAILAGGDRGRLTKLQRRDLAYEVEKTVTLTPEHKEIIISELKRGLDRTENDIWDFK